MSTIALAGPSYTVKTPQTSRVISSTRSRSTEVVNSLSNMVGQVAEQGKTLAGYGWAIFHIVVATLMGISSSISASLAKDSTAMDYLAKGGIVGSILFGIAGAVKFIQVSKAKKNEEASTMLRWNLNEADTNGLWKASVDLKAQTNGSDTLKPLLGKDSVDIFKLVSDAPIPPATSNLIKSGVRTYHDEVAALLKKLPVDNVINNASVFEIVGTSADKTTPVKISDLQDEYALTAGLLAASGIKLKLEPEFSPKEFSDVYTAGESYTRADYGTKLKSILESKTTELSDIVDTYNYLRILEVAAKEAFNEPSSPNESVARRNALYRAAIISSTGIKADSLDKVNQAIKELHGKVNADMTKLNEYVGRLIEDARKTADFPFEFTREPHPEYGEILNFERKLIA